MKKKYFKIKFNSYIEFLAIDYPTRSNQDEHWFSGKTTYFHENGEVDKNEIERGKSDIDDMIIGGYEISKEEYDLAMDYIRTVQRLQECININNFLIDDFTNKLFK